MLQVRAHFRQKAAQTGVDRAKCLADATRWGSVYLVDGKPIVAPFADQPIPTPSLVGRACASCAGLPDFFCFARGLRDRRSFAEPWLAVGNRLRTRPATGSVPPSGENKNQGWAGCEQQKSSRQWRCVWALRPAATQSVNRRFSVPAGAFSALPWLVAIRYLARSSGRPPTYFIARPVRATATDLLSGQFLSDSQPPSGPVSHTQRAVAGFVARGGVLRSHNPQSKDQPCSTRS